MSQEEFVDFVQKLNKVHAYLEKEPLAVLKKEPKIQKIYANADDGTIAANSPEEFEVLKELLEGDQWPHAVPPNFICNENDHERKLERADGILEELIEVNFNGLKFLDFGCGEGYVAKQALLEGARIAVGYDIVETPSEYFAWEQREGNFLLTTHLEKLKEFAPFDIIMLYDVLDHVVDRSPQEVLTQVRELCDENTKVFVRCHPWCSRHGGHLYTKINKAFAHLIFNEKELETLGCKLMPSRKVIFPLKIYRSYFEETGFSIWWEDTNRDMPTEKFFSNHPVVKRRIMAAFNQKVNAAFPSYQMDQNWNDFTISIKSKS